MKIALYISSKADTNTRQRFFQAVEKIDQMLKAWMVKKAGGVGALEEWDASSNVVWIKVNGAEHIQTCKGIAKLTLERHGVGDKYEIVVNCVTRNHQFSTERLLVNEWHSFSQDEWPLQKLDYAAQQILTERVTRHLPPSWQGPYTLTRARQWVIERDKDGTTLLIVDKAEKQAIGMIILSESEVGGNLRLGYMLSEDSWGKGFASELVGGFVSWCRRNDIRSITGGVEPSNIASRRVLEKCGFVPETKAHETEEQLFTLEI